MDGKTGHMYMYKWWNELFKKFSRKIIQFIIRNVLCYVIGNKKLILEVTIISWSFQSGLSVVISSMKEWDKYMDGGYSRKSSRIFFTLVKLFIITFIQ